MKKTMLVAAALVVIAVSIPSRLWADNPTNSVRAIPHGPPPRPDLLKTCPVSGDKLGEMGRPYEFVYNGQQVKLCCPDCKKDFDKNPEKYMKLIRAADKRQKK